MKWNITELLEALDVDPMDWALEMMESHLATAPDFDPDLTLANIPRTDLVAARAIKEKFGSRLSYVSASKTWYVWDGRVHTPVDSDAVAKNIVYKLFDAACFALDNVDYYYEAISGRYHGSEDKDDKKRLKKIQAKWDRIRDFKKYRDNLADNRGAVSLVQAMETAFHTSADHFNDSQWLAVRNGVYDLEAVRRDRVWNLLPHDHNRPVYRYLDVEDLGDDCQDVSTWNTPLQRFLGTSVEDEAQGRFLMRALAAALIGGEGRTRRIVALQGAPSSGKSMLLSVLEDFCAGTDFYSSPGLDAIEHGARAPEHARWRMRNARLATFSEARKKLDQTFLLGYSGGDPYAVEAKYQNGLTVHPHGIVFIANNYPLNVDKTDRAMLDRLAVVYFPHSFTDTATDARFRRDPDLGDAIKADRYGTLQMFKAAYLDYLDNGLDRTELMERRLAGETADSNTVAEWLESSVRFRALTANDSKSMQARVTDAFKSYKLWETGLHLPRGEQLARGDFNRLMSESGYPKVQSNGIRFAGLCDLGPLYERP